MRNWIIGIILVSLIMLIGMFWGLVNMRIDWLQIIMVVFTAYGMSVIFIAAVNKPKEFPVDDSYHPFVSIIIPARNEEFVIAETVRSLMGIDYKKNNGEPNFEVLVMDDNSSDRTLQVASALIAEYPNLKVIHRGADIGGKGKSDVLNHGVKEARGAIIGVFDADTRVPENFLHMSIPYFADPKVGGVQGRVHLYNRDKNILTQLQHDEFAYISHLYQLGKEMLNGVTALGGNGQLVRREAIDAVNGWNYLSPTEDLDLTFRFLFNGWETRYAPKAEIWQEGVERVYPFIRQRVRWAEGFLKCIFDYLIPLLIGRYDFMKKLDGFMTMGRILIPFYVWIGYFYIILSFVNGLEFRSGISGYLIAVSSWLFFAAMMVGMVRIAYPNILVAVLKVFQYSIYGALWIVAIPWGFYNCIKHIDDISWDKTVHTGSSGGDDTGTSVETEIPSMSTATP